MDDDQEPWKGAGGAKQKNDRKAHGTGISSYKGCDETMFCFAHIHPYNPKIKDKQQQLGTSLIEFFNEQLPPQQPYLICADAGPLGSVPHAQYLADRGRQVLFSIVPTRDGSNKHHPLSAILDADLDEHKYHTLYGNSLMVQAWRAKSGNKGGKIVHFATNMPSADRLTTVDRYNKKDKEYDEVDAPESVKEYNTLKWFIDEKRSITARVCNHFRVCKPYCAMMRDIMLTYKHNMYL